MPSGIITMTFNWDDSPNKLTVTHHKTGSPPHILIEMAEPELHKEDWDDIETILTRHLKGMLKSIRLEMGG